MTTRTVLITGGSTGIGHGLARRLLNRGDDVFITGRSRRRLSEAQAALPGVHVLAGDLARPEDREELADVLSRDFPSLDLLVNNAGIQRRVPLAIDDAPWTARQAEIDLLLAAPIHLTALLIPVMLWHGQAGDIVNVTSGGAYIPQPFAPAYSACKAALHSYTVTLRHALTSTPLRVREIIPPAVATGLSCRTEPHGADVDDFCDAALADLDGDQDVIGYGQTATPAFLQRLDEEHDRFTQGADRFPVDLYATP